MGTSPVRWSSGTLVYSAGLADDPFPLETGRLPIHSELSPPLHVGRTQLPQLFDDLSGPQPARVAGRQGVSQVCAVHPLVCRGVPLIPRSQLQVLSFRYGWLTVGRTSENLRYPLPFQRLGIAPLDRGTEQLQGCGEVGLAGEVARSGHRLE